MSQPPNVTTSSQPPPVAVAADSPPPPAASLPPPADSIPPPVSIAPPPPPPSSPPPPASSPPPPSTSDAIVIPTPPPPNITPPPPPVTTPPPPADITPPPPADITPPSPPPKSKSSPSPSPWPSPSPPLPLTSHSRPPASSSYGKLIPSADRTINSLLKNEKVILAGVVAGAGLLLFIMILLLVCLTRRRRKRRQRDDDMHYYRDNSSGNGYYNNSGNWSNTNGSHNNHEMRMPPSTQVSSEYSWQIQPPPPPPPPMMMSSNEMNYSASSYSAPTPTHPPPLQSTISLGINQSSFSYQDLAAATGGFAQANLLGQGGFGYVHKGVLPNGKEVAVKSLKANSGQGETEFQAEVDIISRVHHRHLVSLVGYCISGSQRMLVYELVPNDTLESHLHGTGNQVMDWPTRMKVALGAAKGFSYLHEDCHPRIIHRDIKASNILLDENFEAKVADFGLAKLSLDTNTHISTRIMGTFGYLAPEYAASGKLTDKSDVYSYGVVLLELITGKRPIDIHSEEDSLVDWARPVLKRAIEGESSYNELADPLLDGKYDPQEMLRMIACADACVRHSSRRRPRMSQVVRALEGDASFEELGEAMRHSPSMASMGFGSSSGSEFESKKYKKSGLSSQDFSSHEYGATGESINSGRSSMA